MLCLASKGYKAPTICNLLKAKNLSCTRKNVFLLLKRYMETHSIARKLGSGHLPKVIAEIKTLFEQQMHIDDETNSTVHRLLESRGVFALFFTAGDLLDGHFAVAHIASSYAMLINRSGRCGPRRI